MVRQKHMDICKGCQREMYILAKGMCCTCYRKAKQYVIPVEICSQCGLEKEVNARIYDLPVCKSCTQRNRRRKLMDGCSICGRHKRVLTDGICNQCIKNELRKQHKCESCGEVGMHFAKGMCSRCYKSQWKNARIKTCISCGQECVVHSHDHNGMPLCMSCYVALRIETCLRCGLEKRVAKRLSDGSMLCWYCYRLVRPQKQCAVCKELSILAVSEPPMCFHCYAIEYNRKPEVCARKAVYVAKRRQIESEGDFTVQDWLDIMHLWNWKCAYCGAKLLHGTRSTDHIVPLTRNGKNTRNNIVPCCRSCNSQKNNRLLSEWLSPEIYEQVILRIANVTGGYDNDR